jgi:ATP-dependent Lon protease
MCFVDDSGRVSAIGTTLEVKDFLVEPSGRMYITNKGIERFRVTNVVKQKPVLVCDVEVLPEDDDQSDEVRRPMSG